MSVLFDVFARMSRADEQLMSPDITNDGEILYFHSICRIS